MQLARDLTSIDEHLSELCNEAYNSLAGLVIGDLLSFMVTVCGSNAMKGVKYAIPLNTFSVAEFAPGGEKPAA